ncbi:hypothetical protein HYH02_002854 [Chlamydomonas schloesseri]|uniref:AAA+ ATPase domain-containing protein n=1 Tax=Chlamydomonas schloesseri TaxID=2026947 RepID=A0A836BAG0_9CHLO|nr:hypothetical protein HYH02_002854 [Chlamydomonas schloesseri]|eukprot:KAG2452617.1 hypothetical protein HYH02_002854 [Chlamydomonas schloesseri]
MSAAFATALEGVLLHAVAALEAEDAGTTADALTAYNSAWCALTCAVELHGGPDGTGLHELVRETCRALLDTYRLRFEPGGDGGDFVDETTMEVLRQCQRHVAPGGSLDELAGLGNIKQELRMALLLPLRMPHLFTGIRHPPRNFLLHGPPGTGKTMLVERIASETGAALLVLTPGAILSKWAGESEKQLRAVFTAAACMGRPCIVFMDEVDSLGSARGSGDDPMSRRLLNELLVHMSLLAGQQHQQGQQRQQQPQKPQQLPRPGARGAPAGQSQATNPADSGAGNAVYVFAATNRIQDCDPALLRRFDRRIAVPLPDAAARQAFLQGVLEQPELAGHMLTPDHVLKLTELTAGYSGSDLSQLCREAAMQPLRELLERQLVDLAAMQQQGSWPRCGGSCTAPGAPGEESHSDIRALAMEDFEEVMLTTRTAAADASVC